MLVEGNKISDLSASTSSWREPRRHSADCLSGIDRRNGRSTLWCFLPNSSCSHSRRFHAMKEPPGNILTCYVRLAPFNQPLPNTQPSKNSGLDLPESWSWKIWIFGWLGVHMTHMTGAKWWVPTGRIFRFALELHCTGCTGYVTLSHVVSLCRTQGARSTRWNWDQSSNVRSSFKGLIYIYIYELNKGMKQWLEVPAS